MWGNPGIPTDSFYEVKADCDDVPKTNFKIKNGKTLSQRRWQAAFSPDGHLDFAPTLSRIQRGGIHPTIRGEVWEFLLGCFDPKSTSEEREQVRERRRTQYAKWKEECQEMDGHVGSGKVMTAPIITEDGQPIDDPLVLLQAVPGVNAHNNQVITDKKIIQWKLTLHQIGLDVLRTDRLLVFYEKQENLAKLWDILAVYAWIDKDVGYCQGMSDICSPMIILLDDEADAFWCFEHLMRRLVFHAMEALNSLSLPPGFGFHPTDSELISHYLKRKIHGIKIEYEVIPEVDIYKHEPWDLPAKCKVPTRDSKWHFFASRDKKYPNGSRSKRATEAGYWKSTGKDRNIKYQNRTIGTKKTLVFHEGRPPHGKRTVWIMHEYYINESECQDAPDLKDSYVLCRITKRDCWEMDGENVSKQGEKVKESSNEPDDVVSSVVKPNKSSSQFESIEDKDIEAIFTELLDPNFSATPTLTEVKSVPMEGLGSFALNNDPFDPHFIAEVSEDSHLLFPVEEYYDILQSESQGFDVFGQLDIGSLDALGVQQGDIFADLNDNYTGIQVRERGLKTSTSNLNQRIRLQASKMESQSEGCLSQIVEVKKDFRIVSSDGKQGPTEINAVQWDLNAKSNKSGLSSIRGFVRGICSFLSSRCSSASMKSFFLCACMGTTALIYIFSALVL